MNSSVGILTSKEAAAELRCSTAHLSHLVNGKLPGLPVLPCIRMGRRVLIRRETLTKWLAEAESVRLKSAGQELPLRTEGNDYA